MPGRVQNDVEGRVLAGGLGMDDDKGVLLWIGVSPFLLHAVPVGFQFALGDGSKFVGRFLIDSRLPIRSKGEERKASDKEGQG